MEVTSIEQSKHLLHLGLNVESADMFWPYHDKWYSEGDEWEGYEDYPRAEPYLEYTREKEEWKKEKQDFPAWSISALDELTKVCNRYERTLSVDKKWNVFAVCGNNVFRSFDICPKGYKTPFDAAYALVVWLLKNKCI